jgi:gliding motility-associated-like protein
MRILLTIILQIFTVSVFAAAINTYTVDQLGDAGNSSGPFSGDLRYCVSQAVNSGDVINFNITTGKAPYVITLTSDLIITAGITIDGTSQPGFLSSPGTPVISISGSTSGYGFILSSITNYAYIYSLHFNNPGGTAITVDGPGITNIQGCNFGTDLTGNNYSSTLPPDTAIYSINGSSISVGQGTANVILSPHGVVVNSPTSYSYIWSNYIGLTRAGLNPGGVKRPINKGIELLLGTATINLNTIGNCDAAGIVIGANSNVVGSNVLGKDANSSPAPNGRGIWVKGTGNIVSSNTITNSAIISSSSGAGIDFTGTGINNNNTYSNYFSCNVGGGIVFNGITGLTAPVFNGTSFYVYPDYSCNISGTGAPASGTVEYYLVDILCPSSPVQGTFLGNVTADASGNWNITTINPSYGGKKIVVVGINSTNDNSSVFSVAIDLVSFPCNTVTSNAGPDATTCGTSVPLNGSVTNAAGGIWSSSGNGTFSPSVSLTTSSFPNYAPSAQDILAGSVTITLTTQSATGGCPDVTDQFILTLPVPTALIYDGIDFHACPSTSIALQGHPYNVAGGTWSFTGSGSLSSTTSLNPTYIPSAADITAGSVGFTFTPNAGSCPGSANTVQMFLDNTPPQVSVGAKSPGLQCSSNPYIFLAEAYVTSGQSVTTTWLKKGTAGAAVPIQDTIIFGYSYYAPTPLELINGVTLFFKGTSPGCPSYQDTLQVNYVPAPTIFAGNDTTLCANVVSIALSKAKVTNLSSTGGIFWTVSNPDGSGILGSFSTKTDIVHPIYKPGSMDIGSGTTLRFSTISGPVCPSVYDDININYNTIPVTYAGTDTTVCQGDSIHLMNGSVQGVYPHKWVSAGSNTGKFFPSDTAIVATYVPSEQDFKKVAFTLSLTANNNGCVGKDELLLILIPKPDIGVGTPQNVCPGTVTDLHAAAPGLDQVGLWTKTKGSTGHFADSSSSDTRISFSDTVQTNTYIWTITDLVTGCQNKATYVVNHCYSPPLIVYNALSPNGDGLGEFLQIDNIDFYTNNQVTIFNHWGEMVFKMSHYKNNDASGNGNAFIGRSNVGTVEDLPSGSYYYYIDKGENKTDKGFLVIQK